MICLATNLFAFSPQSSVSLAMSTSISWLALYHLSGQNSRSCFTCKLPLSFYVFIFSYWHISLSLTHTHTHTGTASQTSLREHYQPNGDHSAHFMNCRTTLFPTHPIFDVWPFVLFSPVIWTPTNLAELFLQNGRRWPRFDCGLALPPLSHVLDLIFISLSLLSDSYLFLNDLDGTLPSAWSQMSSLEQLFVLSHWYQPFFFFFFFFFAVQTRLVFL